MTIYQQLAGKPHDTVIPVIEDNATPLFDRKIRSFLDAVKTGGPSPVPSGQILYNQAILSGIAESAEMGKEIKIKIPEI